MSIEDPIPPRRGIELSAIDPNLAADLDRLESEMADRRRRIFRAYAGRSVCLASPLLIDCCTAFELDEAAWRLRPPPAWPNVSHVDRFIRRPSARLSRLRGRNPGWRLLRLTQRSAHLVVSELGFVLGTNDAGGTLSLEAQLTADAQERLLGASLFDACPNKLFRARPYRIMEVRRDFRRGRTVIDFAVPPVEWRLPWNRPWHLYDSG